MALKDNKNQALKLDKQANQHISTSAALDDEQRIKVLSPSMLVVKRFFRNRLAIVGLVIIVFMFLFSFAGPLLYTYGETQQFMKVEEESSTYAGATYNDNFYYLTDEGRDFTSITKAAFILAIKDGKETFSSSNSAGDVSYNIEKLSEETYNLKEFDIKVNLLTVGGERNYNPVKGFELTDGFKTASEAAIGVGEDSFEFDGVVYNIYLTKKSSYIYETVDAVLLSKNVYTPYNEGDVITYSEALMAERCMVDGTEAFFMNEKDYKLENFNDKTILSVKENGEFSPKYEISNLIITPNKTGIFLSIPFRDAVAKAIEENQASFTFTDADGRNVEYNVIRKDLEYTIQSDSAVDLLDNYASPSLKHFLGTDGSGMDMFTRLMYGGRISLSIGFVVIFIETFIGVIMGGISGYFGGWIDTVIMRIVDTINCIPNLPLYIIIGSVMSTLKIDPTLRIYLLMVILGITGWPGIARVVRGQILSLREQEFMTAAEALGISTSRRIFRHLVPNVIPQLIVYATMGLGSVILTEATLSFLNLGVKYPYASWGNIVNAVNDSFVLTNYWFVWIPAGMLILLTVLGFNFIGDGLRDAFDPKMKR